jgi:hypothetical protein
MVWFRLLIVWFACLKVSSGRSSSCSEIAQKPESKLIQIVAEVEMTAKITVNQK